jgi:hypothetical protein
MVFFYLKIRFHILHLKQKFLVKLHSIKDESLINQFVIKMTFYGVWSRNYNKMSNVLREQQIFTLC